MVFSEKANQPQIDGKPFSPPHESSTVARSLFPWERACQGMLSSEGSCGNKRFSIVYPGLWWKGNLLHSDLMVKRGIMWCFKEKTPF